MQTAAQSEREAEPKLSNNIIFKPIGYIRSPHQNPHKTPIQPIFAEGYEGCAEISPEYEMGLRDIEGFSHLIVLYYLHYTQAPGNAPAPLIVKPFLEDKPHGVFATRYPRRPNAIGLSILPLIRREGNILLFDRIDILDGTPILDIKPFVKRFDYPDETISGWVDHVDGREAWLRGRRAQPMETKNENCNRER